MLIRILALVLLVGFGLWCLFPIKESTGEEPQEKVGEQTAHSVAAESPPQKQPKEKLEKRDISVAKESMSQTRGMLNSVPYGVSTKNDDSARLHGTWFPEEYAVEPMRMVRAILLDSESGGKQVIAQTDAQGQYEIFLQPGRYKIRFGTKVSEIELKASEERQLDCPAVERCSITVRIEGQGIEAVNNLIRIESRLGEGLKEVVVRRTDQRGEARFLSVPIGNAEIFAEILRSSPGSKISSRASVKVEADEPNYFVLRPPEGRLVLTLRNGGAGLSGAAIRIWYEGEEISLRGAADKRGNVDMDMLREGVAKVQVTHPMYPPVVFDAQISKSGEVRGVNIPAPRPVRFKATDNKGRAMHTRIFAFCTLGGVECKWNVATDKTGSGIIRNLPRNSTKLTFKAPYCEDLVLDLGEGHNPGEVVHLRFERRN